jgi:hypothetical protein
MEYIIGTTASLDVQWLKIKLGTNVMGTYLVPLLASFVLAAIYVLVKETSIWPVLVQVLTAAGAFYACVISRFETK